MRCAVNAKKTAVLLAAVLWVCAPFTAKALEERTIQDEPGVRTAPGQTSAQPAPQPAPQPVPQDASGGAAPAPANGQWEPGAQEPYYQPDYKDSSQGSPNSSQGSSQEQPSQGRGAASWTPGGNSQDAGQDAGQQYPTSPGAYSGTSGGTSGTIFTMPEARQVENSPRADTYSRKEVDTAVMGFFEGGARGLAELISKAFDRYGEPTGFIKGSEGAGAFVVGLRYGEGQLYLKNGQTVRVYWQSPSVGFDLGGNLSKVFCLVYGLTDPEGIFQRFPSVDGSAYLIGGFGMNYQASGNIVLAPIRFGVGLRLGANIGYMGFTRTRTINPF